MSTLQISLAVVGVILLGLIVAYNTWTHRRNAPKRAQYADGDTRLGEGHSRFDPALDGVDVTDLPPSHRAPVVDPLMDTAPAQEAQAGIWAADPTLDAAPATAAVDGGAAVAVSPAAAAERKLALDGLIDAIAPLRVEHVVTGDAALMVQPTTRRAGSKQFRIEGLNAATQEWETVRAGQRYTAFQAGVQLANRLGALNEIEFSEFAAKVQGFANAHRTLFLVIVFTFVIGAFAWNAYRLVTVYRHSPASRTATEMQDSVLRERHKLLQEVEIREHKNRGDKPQ